MSIEEKKFPGLVQVILLTLSLLVLFKCSEQEKESERSKTIRILTNNHAKDWMIESIYVDDVASPISTCDSSYTLTLISDFTWEEIYRNFSCYNKNNGTWALNDENNVITIQFIDQFSSQLLERKFELLELTDNYFSYQYVQNNALKRIRLTER